MNNSHPEHGYNIINNSSKNKGTGFTREEREHLGLRGLLPHRICSLEVQKNRVLENLRRKEFDIERYIFLRSLEDRNERLYYRVLIDNIKELMPIVYTPTVGQACREFAHIFRHSKGFYITPGDRGEIRTILNNWPHDDVRIIVVTDGSRILGLGDLGANGMGIPIGKLALYTAGAGIHPRQCMPVMLDVGTNNESLLNDPLYLGWPSNRIDGEEYYSLIDEFIMAVKDRFPKALIQFEDFLTPYAYGLLRKYQQEILCFNDDIQGTAAVALAGVYASLRIAKKEFKDLRFLFLGAGSAATGIADLMTKALVLDGLEEEEAHHRLSFVDINGLLVKSRKDLAPHNLVYVKEGDSLDFISAIKKIKPDVLIGATGVPGTFNKEALEAMAEINDQPIIFALSNPTDRAECTAKQAYGWTKGKAVFATGSPYDPVVIDGKRFEPAQGNNAYIFPGVGLGAIATKARHITDEMFLAAAKTLANKISEDKLELGAVYPPLTNLRELSLDVAIAVAETAFSQGLSDISRPVNLKEHIKEFMWDPTY